MKNLEMIDQIDMVTEFNDDEIVGTAADEWANDYIEYVFNNMGKIKEQLNLQNDDIDANIKNYTRAEGSKQKGETRSGNSLILKSTTLLSAKIEAYKKRSQVAKRRYIKDTDANTIAYAVLKVMFNNTIDIPCKVTQLAYTIGGEIKNEVKYEWLQREHKEWAKEVNKNLLTNNQSFRKTTVKKSFTKFAREINNDVEDIDKKTQTMLGSDMIEMVIEATGLFELKNMGNGTPYFCMPSDKLIEYIAKSNETLSVMSGEKYPMVCKPKPWTHMTDTAGYLPHQKKPGTNLIRGIRKDNLSKLGKAAMLDTMAAVNAIQNTPWVINHSAIDRLEYMMETVSQDLAEKLDITSVNERSLPELTDKIKETPELLKEWRGQAQQVYLKRAREGSKRTVLLQKLHVAKKFKKYDEIFFPHCLDFRSRVYPITTVLNTQGDDISKSLLKLSVAKPLGERGLRWLKIHVANLIGWDKLSFDNRVINIDDNMDKIKQAVENYETSDYWLTWDKPFYGLSCAAELVEALELEDPTTYMSHTAVAVDGSCSGIQHYSCLLKDSVGAYAVNLIDSPEVQDIYKIVADKLIENLKLITGEDYKMAQKLLPFVSRKLTKRGVMTTAYGVTSRGIIDQVFELQKKEGWGWDYDMVRFAGEKIAEAISQSIIGASVGMDFLKDCARIIAKAKASITWTTPNGFPIRQSYTRERKMNLNCFSGVIQLQLKVDTGSIDTAKGTSSIAPNYIHGMDAAHLGMTTNNAYDKGIRDFAMIHDSFGTHACNVDVLVNSLLEEMTVIYSENNLAIFKEEMEEILIKAGRSDLINELPEIPAQGDLDLSKLMEATYAFA